jgi:hypothetical protein
VFERVSYVHARDGARLALTELSLAERGTGPTFLLVHGFAQNRNAFARVRAMRSRSRR